MHWQGIASRSGDRFGMKGRMRGVVSGVLVGAMMNGEGVCVLDVTGGP